VSESLSDNIQRGALRDRMTLTRGSSLTLEEEEEDEEEGDICFLENKSMKYPLNIIL
jgi:hypothetical protein